MEVWGIGINFGWDYWGKGVVGKWMERYFGLQKGSWIEGFDLGFLIRKVFFRGFSRQNFLEGFLGGDQNSFRELVVLGNIFIFVYKTDIFMRLYSLEMYF